jgi:predicted alpha-1,2-mannosidase
VKGITGFDAEDAYTRMRAAAMDPQDPPGGRGGRRDIGAYLTLGYVPSSVGGSVSKTVEYAIDDLALGELAAALGKDGDAAALAERARGWRKLYDPASGFLVARAEDGTPTVAKYSPLIFGDEYVEASGWHTLFGPIHDVEGLIELHGGREELVAKLEEFFEKGRLSYEENPPDGTVKGSGMRPYFWASNEPTMHIVYLFAQAGRPDLTQKWVRWIQHTFFRPTPDGLPGNDDGGTMSAWYLFNAMGFYPLAGTDRYFIGAPTYPKLVLHLPGGDFTIEAPGVSDENPYVQAVELNGAPLSSPTLRHRDLKPGGTLRFTMGPQPSAWGKE